MRLEIVDKKGLVVNTFDSLTDCCAKYLNVSHPTVRNRLNKNLLFTLNNNEVYIKKVFSVPVRKCSKFKNITPKSIGEITTVRTYSTQPTANNLLVKFYEDAYNLKKLIVKENKGESGIYMWTNKITGDIYIGQSSNLAVRFKNYFSLSYLKRKTLLVEHWLNMAIPNFLDHILRSLLKILCKSLYHKLIIILWTPEFSRVFWWWSYFSY